MKHVERAVRRVVDDLGLRDAGPIVVGLSGGADSTALAVLLAEAGCTIRLVHVDHGLRPADAAADAAWCAELAGRLGVELTIEEADVREAGDGIEAAARATRFQAFDTVAREVGAEWVALGHNRDDQIETVLMRIVRGTGIGGLAGMSENDRCPWHNPHVRVVRPLLGVARESIRAWCRSRGLAYRDDPTNLWPVFTRNRFRHEVMPLLRSINTGVDAHVLGLSEDARMLDLTPDQRVADVLAATSIETHGAIFLHRSADLLAAPSLVRRGVLRAAWERVANVSLARSHIVAMERALLAGRGEVALPDLFSMQVGTSERWGAYLGHGHVRIGPPEPRCSIGIWGPRFLTEIGNDDEFWWPGWVFNIQPADGPLGAGPDHLVVDREEVGRLVARQWEPGDRIRLTSGGRQKVQDVFTNAKVSEAERHWWPVIADQSGDVIWVVGIKRGARPLPTGHSAMVVKATRNASQVPDVYSEDGSSA
jgi:tRNA(Ile)-lysidine synthase